MKTHVSVCNWSVLMHDFLGAHNNLKILHYKLTLYILNSLFQSDYIVDIAKCQVGCVGLIVYQLFLSSYILDLTFK